MFSLTRSMLHSVGSVLGLETLPSRLTGQMSMLPYADQLSSKSHLKQER
jgi:hypothetical protein